MFGINHHKNIDGYFAQNPIHSIHRKGSNIIFTFKQCYNNLYMPIIYANFY